MPLLGMCEELLELGPCFALQNQSTIECLLAPAAAEELPLEGQSDAGRLAAELTAKFSLDPQPARMAIWKIVQAARAR